MLRAASLLRFSVASQICCIGSRWEPIIVSASSSRRRATVHRTVAFDHSNLTANKKEPIPNGIGSFLELLARFELATSSLPRIQGAAPPVTPRFYLYEPSAIPDPKSRQFLSKKLTASFFAITLSHLLFRKQDVLTKLDIFSHLCSVCIIF